MNRQPEQSRTEMEVPLWFTRGRFLRAIQYARQVQPAVRQEKPVVLGTASVSGQSLALRPR